MKTLPAAIALAFCQASATAQGASYQDLWWNAAEPGWGINVLHQGDTLVATWFIYDIDGKPMWLLGVLEKAAAASYAGAIYRFTGPAYSAGTFDPAKVTETVVGTARFDFTDAANAAVTTTVNGSTVTRTVTRQTYAAPRINGTFLMAGHRERAGCADVSQNGSSFVYGRAYDFYTDGATLSVGYGSVDSSGTFVMSCSAVGRLDLHGSVAGFAAPFTCTNGAAGTLAIDDLTTTDAGILGETIWQFNAASGGCRYVDSVSGARKHSASLL
jgi:hypothetical protein